MEQYIRFFAHFAVPIVIHRALPGLLLSSSCCCTPFVVYISHKWMNGEQHVRHALENLLN